MPDFGPVLRGRGKFYAGLNWDYCQFVPFSEREKNQCSDAFKPNQECVLLMNTAYEFKMTAQPQVYSFSSEHLKIFQAIMVQSIECFVTTQSDNLGVIIRGRRKGNPSFTKQIKLSNGWHIIPLKPIVLDQLMTRLNDGGQNNSTLVINEIIIDF